MGLITEPQNLKLNKRDFGKATYLSNTHLIGDIFEHDLSMSNKYEQLYYTVQEIGISYEKLIEMIRDSKSQ